MEHGAIGKVNKPMNKLAIGGCCCRLLSFIFLTLKATDEIWSLEKGGFQEPELRLLAMNSKSGIYIETR